MNQKLLLVDFENVHQVDLSRLDESFQIIIFVGANQKSVPIELVTNAQKLGTRVEWQKVDGVGSNALDFFIACQLGRIAEKSPKIHCIVLSKDKGFDPLLKYLNKNGLKCKRINSFLELEPKAATTTATEEEPNYKRVVELLARIEKKSRPRKLNTLSQHISSMFQKKIAQKDIDRIIDLLFANKLISETNNTISYDF
ncbi:MAG: PIN domain-containing protein [Methylococcaceae bacterium]